MKKLFCSYCGERLDDYERCDNDCERIIAQEAEERHKDFLDRYYEENAYGFYQQDMIDLRRFER